MVLPDVNAEPGEWELVSVTLQLSLAVGAVQFTVAWQLSASMVWVMSPGMSLMVGEIVSSTVTLKLSVVTFPAPSVAV